MHQMAKLFRSLHQVLLPFDIMQSPDAWNSDNPLPLAVCFSVRYAVITSGYLMSLDLQDTPGFEKAWKGMAAGIYLGASASPAYEMPN